MFKSKKISVRKIVLLGLIVFWIMFIWSNSMFPAAESSEQSGAILEWINGWLLKVGDFQLSSFIVRKAAHMFEFFVLSLLVCCLGQVCEDGKCQSQGVKSIGRWTAWGIGVSAVVASIDEGIQLFVPGRSGEIRDVLVDCCGAVIGAMVVAVVTSLSRKI